MGELGVSRGQLWVGQYIDMAHVSQSDSLESD
jgi:hypothetical protein